MNKRVLIFGIFYVSLMGFMFLVFDAKAQEQNQPCFVVTNDINVEYSQVGPCQIVVGFNRTIQAGSNQALSLNISVNRFDPNRVIWLSVCISDPEVSSNGIKISSNELEQGLFSRERSVRLGTFRSGGKDCYIHRLRVSNTTWLIEPIGNNAPPFMLSVSGFSLPD